MKFISELFHLGRALWVLFSFTGAAFSASCQPPVSSPVFTSGTPSKTAINTGFLGLKYLNPDEGRFWSQDKYDGDSEDPLSLHNYLYGNASPVIELDPTGYETIAETEYAQEIGARLEANGIVNTARARQIVSYVCKGATAIDAAAQGISGVYIIVGIEETYVGSSINILTRLAGHSGKVGSLIAEVGEGAITKIPVDLGAAGEFGLSEGGLLRTVEQRFLQDMTPGGIGSNGNLNKIRARAFKKFDAFVKSFCPGGVLK